jgi:hypothetical protein
LTDLSAKYTPSDERDFSSLKTSDLDALCFGGRLFGISSTIRIESPGNSEKRDAPARLSQKQAFSRSKASFDAVFREFQVLFSARALSQHEASTKSLRATF